MCLIRAETARWFPHWDSLTSPWKQSFLTKVSLSQTKEYRTPLVEPRLRTALIDCVWGQDTLSACVRHPAAAAIISLWKRLGWQNELRALCSLCRRGCKGWQRHRRQTPSSRCGCLKGTSPYASASHNNGLIGALLKSDTTNYLRRILTSYMRRKRGRGSSEVCLFCCSSVPLPYIVFVANVASQPPRVG